MLRRKIAFELALTSIIVALMSLDWMIGNADVENVRVGGSTSAALVLPGTAG